MPILQFKYGRSSVPAESLAQLKELSQFVDETANIRPNPRLPWVGAAAFSHKGGTHVNAVQKVIRSYEHIDPALVGNARHVLISDLAGRSNIVMKARELGFDVTNDDAAAAGHAGRASRTLEHQGYEFEAADGSLALLIRRALTDDAAAVRRRRLSRVDAPRRRDVGLRGDRQGAGRQGDRRTPSPTATARSTRSTPRCARRWSTFYPQLEHGPADRLQGPHHRLDERHRREDARAHRVERRHQRSGARSASTTTSSRPACRRSSTASSTP